MGLIKYGFTFDDESGLVGTTLEVTAGKHPTPNDSR